MKQGTRPKKIKAQEILRGLGFVAGVYRFLFPPVTSPGVSRQRALREDLLPNVVLNRAWRSELASPSIPSPCFCLAPAEEAVGQVPGTAR